MENLNIDIKKTEEVKCSDCNNTTFVQAFLMRKLSAFLSPTGKETYIPIQVFACKNCGNINEEFMPK